MLAARARASTAELSERAGLGSGAEPDGAASRGDGDGIHNKPGLLCVTLAEAGIGAGELADTVRSLDAVGLPAASRSRDAASP